MGWIGGGGVCGWRGDVRDECVVVGMIFGGFGIVVVVVRRRFVDVVGRVFV